MILKKHGKQVQNQLILNSHQQKLLYFLVLSFKIND